MSTASSEPKFTATATPPFASSSPSTSLFPPVKGRNCGFLEGVLWDGHLAKQAELGVKKAIVSGFYAYTHQPWWESQSFFLMSDPNSSFCAFSDGLP